MWIERSSSVSLAIQYGWVRRIPGSTTGSTVEEVVVCMVGSDLSKPKSNAGVRSVVWSWKV